MLFDTHPNHKPEIHLTENDRTTLRNIAFSALSTPEVVDDLLSEIDRARTVAASDAEKYIGIGSIATYVTSMGDEKTVRLVLPVDANIADGKISILTPVGVALLGLTEGQEIGWQTRDGRVINLTVKKVRSA